MLLELCEAGAVTTSLRSLFQWPIILLVKNFLLMCSLNFPYHHTSASLQASAPAADWE